jgi:hypothetical protein
MATIKLSTGSARLKPCAARNPPTLDEGYAEFTDATEEELAFWNTLSDSEKVKLARESENRCFYDAMHDRMKEEARKGEKQQLRDEELSGGAGPNPQSPVSPPDSPPSPNTPGVPPPPTLLN